MKASINKSRDGWRYFVNGNKAGAGPFPTYPQAKRAVAAAGHDVDNGGWLHHLLSWQFNNHALDGYPEWEIERDGIPAYASLVHVVSPDAPGSRDLAVTWDDLAAADFYYRDYTDSGVPFVRAGDQYRSGWRFATIAERDRFVAWAATRMLP